MTQSERELYLISTLKSENPRYAALEISKNESERKALLRALFNVRPPLAVSKEFLKIQNEYLKEETNKKGVTDFLTLSPLKPDIYVWQGDITALKCDAVVNAANSKMLGCFYPNHKCIDNAIHTFAGVGLRLACFEIMKKQGCDEPVGTAKITPAFNLPCKYVIHTVGPTVRGLLTKNDCESLKSCYRSCLELAEKSGVKSIAFCCISTGEFHFPNEDAAEIAIDTVKSFKSETQSEIKVIFNVFKDVDRSIYERLLK